MAGSDDIKKFIAELSSQINKILSNKQKEQIGESMRSIIYKRTKTGKGVTDDTTNSATLKKLKELDKERYIPFRKRYTGRKGEFFSPARSNLTLTGQMLENLNYKVDGEKISLFVNDTARGDGKTNKKVSEYVSQQGRQFVNLAKTEQRIVKKLIEDIIRENIKRKFK